MKNTKLVSLLKTFSEPEIKKFRDFVNSPFYNKNKNVVKLFASLEKFYPQYDSTRLTDENIFKAVFGDIKYDYFKLRNISSDLYNLGLEFLKTIPNIVTHFYNDYNMITQLRMRKLLAVHKKIVVAYEKEFEKERIKDSIFLFNNYLLTSELQMADVLEKPNSVKAIQSEFNSFFDYSFLNMLKFYCLMLHITKENNITVDMKMFTEVVSYLQNTPQSENPIITIYSYILLLTITRKEEYYFPLKEMYISGYDKLGSEDSYYTNMYICGYCMDMYNINADRRFIKECYDLFKHAYSQKRVTLGELLYPNFINYIKVFTRYGDINLAKSFINDFSGKLDAEQKENSLNFSNALIAFSEGRLESALELASRVNFPWIIMKIQVRLLQLEIYYELGYYEETREMVESFRKSLLRESGISEPYREAFLGFLKCVISLLNLVSENDKEEKKYKLNSLNADVHGIYNHFGIKFWLEDKQEEISKTI